MTVIASQESTPSANTMAAYVSSDPGAELARSVARLMDEDQCTLHGGGLGGAARVSMDNAIAQTILAEIGNMSLDNACECITEICKTGANVIVLGENEDLASYRALRAAGAVEYFAFPVSAQEIIATQTKEITKPQLISLPTPQPEAAPTRASHCIAVMGCNGGVGTSLLAQNLAFHVSSAKGSALQTALIDADLRFGSQAIDLDRKDTPGLLEALSAPDRVDPTFLGSTMEQLNDNLSMYSQQAHIGQSVDQLDAAFAPLLKQMKAKFEALIVDLPRTTFVAHPELAQELDCLVLVVPAGYAGVNVGSRLISLLKSEVPELKILPVLSEFRKDAKLSSKDISKAIKHDLATVLPDSSKLINRAHRAAKPLIETRPRSDYAKATRKLWSQAITETSEPAKKTKRQMFRKAAA